MRIGFLLIIIVSIWPVYLAVVPITEEQALKRANDELSFICVDMNIECARFHSPVLSRDANYLRVFQWQDYDAPGEVTEVSVPYSRIGDWTFGLIGRDVTIGSMKQ